MPQDLTSSTRARVDETVRHLRARIAQLRARPSSVNEENTKRVLITPLLDALGWEVLDLDEVQNEYRTKPQDNPVDYAMFLRRSPCLFVEAKALGQSMADRRWIGQNIGYASVAGVHWCVLTNGDEYRLYNAHAPVDADEKLFRSVCLSDEAQHDLAVETLSLLSKAQMADKQIDTLWAAHYVDRRVKKALEELVAGDDSLVNLLKKRAGGLSTTDVRQALARADVRIVFPSAPRSGGGVDVRGNGAGPQARTSVAPAARPARPGTLGTRPAGASRGQPARRREAPRSGAAVAFADVLRAGLLRVPVTLYATHKKRPLQAEVAADGTISFQGQSYTSPSTAGAAAVDRPSCNGWTFWRFRDPADGQLKLIDELRTRLREKDR